MNRCCLPVAILGLAAFCGAQNVSYTTQARRLDVVIPDLSAKIGRKISVDAALSAEPIAIRVENVDAEDLLAKIADVMSAEWVIKKDTKVLTRTPKIVARLEDERNQKRASYVKRELDRLATTRRKQGDITAENARLLGQQVAAFASAKKNQDFSAQEVLTLAGFRNQSAESRLMVDALLAIGAEAIVAHDAPKRIYAFSPTNAQARIPLPDERLNQYAAERDLLAENMAVALGAASHPTNDSSIDRMVLTNPKGPLRPLLVLRNLADDGRMFASLNVYDGKGGWVNQAFQAFTPASYDEFVKHRATASSTERTELRADIAALARRAMEYQSGGTQLPLTDAAIQVLIHPEIHDPLEVTFSEPLIAIAKMQNLNLVATAGDTVVFPLFYYGLRCDSLSKYQPALYEVVLKDRAREEIEKSDAWMTVKPLDPLTATKNRVDRKALATFQQRTRDQGYSTIEDWSELAAASANVPNLIQTYHDMLVGSPDSSQEGNDWEAYKLFGGLNDAQFNALRNGQTLSFGSLAPDHQVLLLSMLYGNSGANIEPISESQDGSRSILEEPTESCPNGPEDSAQIAMADSIDPVFLATAAAGDHGRDVEIPADFVARMIAEQQRPDLFKDPSYFQSFTYSPKRTVTFTMPLSRNMRLREVLTEVHKPKGPPVGLEALKDNLPADVWDSIQKLVEKHLDDFKLHEKEIKAQGGGVGQPPPR